MLFCYVPGFAAFTLDLFLIIYTHAAVHHPGLLTDSVRCGIRYLLQCKLIQLGKLEMPLLHYVGADNAVCVHWNTSI